MIAGSVTVTNAGVVTKTGVAAELFDLLKAAPPLAEPSAPAPVEGQSADAPTLKAMAVTANTLAPAFAARVPTGTGMLWYGSSDPPSGWLLCDGSAVSRTTYADLFAVLGTTWGVGDGSTTFNLPHTLGASPLGAGTGKAADATAHTFATWGGTETHTLTSAQMPSHTHTLASGNIVSSAAGAVGAAGADLGSAATTAAAGSGNPHPNMHPFFVIRFIIKT